MYVCTYGDPKLCGSVSNMYNIMQIFIVYTFMGKKSLAKSQTAVNETWKKIISGSQHANPRLTNSCGT